MLENHERNAKIFKAFCDEKRLSILEHLRTGEKCVCTLMELLGLGQSSLSYHMKILCEASIVVGRQEGKWTHYSLNEEGSKIAINLLEQITKTSADETKD